MRVLRTLVIVLVVILAVLLGVAYLLPAEFSVQRSSEIPAPPEFVYARVATPRTWARWSAWTTAEDPTLAYTYAGPDTGAGAVMRWTAKKMGNGELEIVRAVPGREVLYRLRMQGSDMRLEGHILLEPSGAGTKVTWHDSGSLGNNAVTRYFGPLMDKMLGAAYEKCFTGLRRETAGG